MMNYRLVHPKYKVILNCFFYVERKLFTFERVEIIEI